MLVACKGPTEAPKPERQSSVKPPRPDRPPPRVPKFDVGPPGKLTRPALADPPEGMASLAQLDPTIRLDIRYATADNFTGAPLSGYLPGGAWLTTEAADALVKVQTGLASEGLALLVFDAYRPQRATQAMVSWANHAGRTKLLDDGYIARHSDHNRGTTVDLTLVDAKTGKELDMGTPWDTFSEASHYPQAKGEPMANRRRLRKAMMKGGFVPYEREWWHFTWPADPKPPARDIPYVRPAGP